MNGFYSIWSKPFFSQKKEKKYYMQDFEKVTLLLSAEEWKKFNGPVQMIADEQAIVFLEEMGLLPVFNAGVTLMEVDERINPTVFWAAGKLEALKQADAPVAMIDLDLIVWQDMSAFFQGRDVCVIHEEPLREEIYPGREFFRMKPEYQFDPALNWNVLPCNTALLYFRDKNLKNRYVEEAQRFMINCVEQQENLCHMVFAEQRLLPMCAAREGRFVTPFVSAMEDLDLQQAFTHIWGHKNVLRFNYTERERFCIKCLNRLKEDAPEAYEIAAKWDDMQEYIHCP